MYVRDEILTVLDSINILQKTIIKLSENTKKYYSDLHIYKLHNCHVWFYNDGMVFCAERVKERFLMSLPW